MKLGSKTFLLALLFSIGLHLSLGTSFNFSDEKAKDKPNEFEITYLSKEEIQQILEQENRANKIKPEDSNLLGKFDQSIEKQTKAKNSGKYKDGNGGKNGKFSFTEKQEMHKEPTKKSVPKNISDADLKKIKLDDLKPKFDWTPKKEQNRQALLGTESQSSDYLKDVAVGNTNLLSTREFIYYTYFNRIKNQLQQYWEPSLQHRLTKLFRSGRQPASQTGPKITKVLITLNDQGNLIRVQVLENSGIRDLDEAAIDAFREAAPFPNPPSGIVESDGTIKIRWDFVLEA